MGMGQNKTTRPQVWVHASTRVPFWGYQLFLTQPCENGRWGADIDHKLSRRRVLCVRPRSGFSGRSTAPCTLSWRRSGRSPDSRWGVHGCGWVPLTCSSPSLFVGVKDGKQKELPAVVGTETILALGAGHNHFFI